MKITKLILVVGLTSTLLTGCSKPPPPPPPPPEKPKAPPPPEPVTLEPLIAAAKVDARVQFPQDRAPVDETLAKAVIDFTNAFAKADSSKLGGMMDPMTKQVLDQLAGNGSLEDEVKKAEALRVVHLTETNISEKNATSATFVFAIQEPGSAYVLAWTVTKVNDAWVFTSAPATSGMHARASEWDGKDFGSYGPTVKVVAAPTPDAPADAATASHSGGGGEKKEDAAAPASTDKTVRTPNGPIKVPTGPGGG